MPCEKSIALSPVLILSGIVLQQTIWAPGDDLLSHGQAHTIIGAEWFHFRVRNGVGWGTLAIITKHKTNSALYGQASRLISTG